MKIYPLFEPRFSLFSLLLSLFIHLGAIIAVVCTSLLWVIKISLIIIMITSVMIFLRLHVYRNSSRAIIKFQPTTDNLWLLTNVTQHSIKAVLQGNSICSLYFVLLNFRAVDSRKKISVIILPDGLSTESFRYLRIMVKGQRLKG